MTPSMAEMLKQPARTSGWDRSLFEDITDEYEQAEEAEPSAQQRKPCHVLLQLVEAKDFASATRVKEELEALGVPIQPNSRYMAAAVYALALRAKGADTRESEMISAFDSWATFVPVPQPLLDSPFFQPKSHNILPKSMAATLRHAVLAAYMGHSSKIALRVVPWAFRLPLPVAGGLRFMQAFADADMDFRGKGAGRRALQENRKHFKSWYALAIRTRCIHGGSEAAFMLAQDAHSRGYEIPLFTLRLLLRTLRDHNDQEKISWVAKEYQTLEAKGESRPKYLSGRGRHLLAQQVYKVLNDGHLPTYENLYSFIDLCISSGDTELFQTVLQRFHTHSNYSRAIRQWANAEMAYYFDKGKELHGLFIFHQYFRSAGIPKAIELMLEKLDYTSVPEYLTTRSVSQSSKVWPDARITLHLWRLLFTATQQQQLKYMFLEFESLYNAFALLKSNPLSVSQDALQQAGKLVQMGRIPPPTAPSPFGLNHYREFLLGISKFNDTLLLAHVISKMRVLGWHPRKGDLDAITTCFARGGSPERLLPLLDALRGDYEESLRSKQDEKDAEGGSRPVASAMYRKAIHSMADVDRYAGAAKIARHLRRKVHYRFGMNKNTDETLGRLNRLAGSS
ncbi:hypothetical protein PHLGIDRAFT_33012 [Phlebiopsis gigantea 11061_1 CR5-6]|uniref:Uncharacterized protein n=1 Tax=Phlebiopsis gigantea (strain 11061_1 CR5-6) TaxID=745531 RepID=A0A0C3PW27_PHLG1|nr:hypothetical protein PHLGIDRAFT_33012 [Phlebiopsis gigantea 11061_1 CR5-6]